jgi:type 1 glutamine amidotransferase
MYSSTRTDRVSTRHLVPSRVSVGLLASILLLANWAAGQLSKEQEARIEEATPSTAAAAPVKPRRLLVINLHVHDGQIMRGHQSIPYGNHAIQRMGERTGAWQTVFGNDISVFKAENLRQFDAVCFNNTAGVLFEDEELRESLLAFVSGGGGFVGIHAAAATFVQWPRYDQWPEFGEMLGAYEDGGHPWKPHETITLKVDDPGHPVNAAFGGMGFEISDEVFQFRQPYSRDRVRVLLSIDTDKTDMSPERRILPERLEDLDLAISWVREYGEGRVFYSSLGHNPHIFWNKPVLEHFLAGIQYALGDLPADATPIPMRKR